MSRTIFNELGENRVINPRSGFSQFVDLSNTQDIHGIKTFISDLITNSDVNFNTTANVGRIVFNPNEPAGSGSQIVSIYTTDENDGNSWIFDSDGNLYYLATGLQPIKIFFSATGEITSVGNINCGSILKTNTIQTNAPFGVIDVLSNIYLKASFFVQDPTNNGTRVLINPSSFAPGEVLFKLFKDNTGSNKSLNFNCDGSLYYNDGGSIWKFYENGDLITEGFLQSNKIQSNYFIGVRPFIKLDNRFIDPNVSSLDIISTYVGFPNPSQTLTTASKYMYINPLSTGNFEMLISNIANKILSSDWATTKINSQYIWSINNIINQNAIILNGLTTGSGNRLEVFGTAGGVRKLYYNTNNELGVIETVTTFWKITGAGAITCASLNASSGIIETTGSVLTNTINPVSGTNISTNSIWNFKTVGGTYTPILLDPITTSGNRLKIDGTLGGTRYLFFNTSSNIGVFNTATSANVWSIDGTTGNINTIGSITYASLTTNLINASTGTNKIQMDNRFFNTGVGSIDLKSTYIGFPQLSQVLDIFSKYMAIVPASDGNFTMSINNIGSRVLFSNWSTLTLTSEFKFTAPTINATTSLKTNLIEAYSGTTINVNPTSNFNFIKSAGVNRIKMFPNSTTGDIMQITRVGDTSYTSGYWYHNNTGNFGYNSGGVSVWELLNNGGLTCNGNITAAIIQATNYLYSPTLYVDNIYSNVSSLVRVNTKLQCLGQYFYNEHNLRGDIAGLWSNRTGLGGSLDGNGNNWASMGGMENNNGSGIGVPAYNSGGTNRIFMWMIETTSGSGKALGIAINRINAPNSYINATNQSTGFALLGFFAGIWRGSAAYSFTGEHSSMVCDEEYDDLMNYNTDDFIGMVVCSSGKIYNLPYTPDGDTYTKQVDNIKSIDSQPMTRLSKKYKDKAVLGVISHIEKVGKNRNDINATSWTGCLPLDKDERRRIRVASIGEGGIWITNEYGNIENGDYITTSNIAGYSTKQDSDFLMNYTIAKATMDCSFDIEKPDDYKTKYLGDGVYASYIACTFHCG